LLFRVSSVMVLCEDSSRWLLTVLLFSVICRSTLCSVAKIPRGGS
jgi:hypothetical protein